MNVVLTVIEILLYNLALLVLLIVLILALILFFMIKHKRNIDETRNFIKELFDRILTWNERWIPDGLDKWEEEISQDGGCQKVSFRDFLKSCGFSFILSDKYSAYWGDLQSVELKGVKVETENYSFSVKKLIHKDRQLTLMCKIEGSHDQKPPRINKNGGKIKIYGRELNVEIFPLEDEDTTHIISVNQPLGNNEISYGTEISIICKLNKNDSIDNIIEVPPFEVPEVTVPTQVSDVFSKSNYLLFCALGGFNFIALIAVFMISLLLIISWKVLPFVIVTSVIFILLSVKLNMKLFGVIYNSLRS
ncbi:hypothetical protein [Paenibacillus azoreducens]|uniref:Uncharacterized protein n=1 Tax=Paenibacillus azoreducens TaxID=116718 RepID=A0A919YEB8_9BACL|nr:hypothetical protein [Paenibacillus azoreducens]GIO49622.1 hypothetical protein J34TS1_43870 [Paenibacillus azoreducens]